MWKLIALLICLVLALPCAQAEELYVKPVENLPEDFIFGMDASCVPALERSGVRYYAADGTEKDVFEILAENGINYIRVRVWNHPFDADGNGYGGGNCDIHNALEIGQRAAKYGMKLLVDFHYSDFWADPAKQMVPLAWKGLKAEEKLEALYAYTRDSLQLLVDGGVDVGMVQIGNETNNGIAGEDDWESIPMMIQSGCRAVREVCPEALIAVHFANPEKVNSYASYAKLLSFMEVDYDVFATSYYPYWHGTLENLAAVLNHVAVTYGKKVMVMETSYAYTAEDTDFNGNTIGEGGNVAKNYPYTVQGQVNCIRDITDVIVNQMENGIGVVYWEGTWISVGGSSWEENSALWEQYGSGWASSYAAAYDPEDAGKYYGGCAVDNQALFDARGQALPSLAMFRLMGQGQELPLRADALEDVDLQCDVNGELILPEAVTAIMSDNSRQSVPVTWDVTAAELADMQSAGVGQHVITGTAESLPAKCSLSLIEYNYLMDYSFEEGGKGWEWTNLASTQELNVENKRSDSLTGTKHIHFWSAGRNNVEFTLEQKVEQLPEGKYRFTVSIMGGDGGQTEIYAYVKVNGKIIATAPMQITSWNVWHKGVTPVFPYDGEGEICVGVYVKCQGAGNGAWGKIDDALLNSVR